MDLIAARRQLAEMGSQQQKSGDARLLVERRKSAESCSGVSQPSGPSDISVGLARGCWKKRALPSSGEPLRCGA